MSTIYIFFDNSNIFITSQAVCEQKEGLMSYKGYNPVRLHFRNLMKLCDCGREVADTFLVTSASYTDRALWENMDGLEGVRSAIFERGRQSKSEQAVDETLQLSMYRTLVNESEPQIAVLLTGDGKGFDEGVGFLKALYDMHQRGWGIEVLSWELSCHRDLKDFAEKNGVFVPLDNYYYSITYVPNGRSVVPLSLVGRRLAKTDPSRSESAQLERLKGVAISYDALKSQYADLLKRHEELEQKYAALVGQVSETERKKGKYDKSMKNKKNKVQMKPLKKEEKQTVVERIAPDSFDYEYPLPDLWVTYTENYNNN